MPTRRDALTAIAGLPLAGCVHPCVAIPMPVSDAVGRLVDGHCHLFNIKDLSAIRFISRVFLHQYPELARLSFAPEDPEAIDLIVSVFLALVGAQLAPTAVHETKLLSGNPARAEGEDAGPVPPDELTEDTIDRVADFLGGATLGVSDAAEQSVRDMIAGEEALGQNVAPLSRRARRAIARHAVTGQGSGVQARGPALILADRSLASFFNFAMQLRRFRHCLADELAKLHRGAGTDPVLLAPAMVDFGRWLRDDPGKGSTFADQIEVWHRISLRKSGPAVHGYVGFCPLRKLLFDRDLLGPGRRIDTPCDTNPLALVRTAITRHGFIGVKLYPPMGFRAADNERRGSRFSYPREILADVFGTPDPANARELGRLLDRALDELYDTCSQLGACIMAHGANSNSAFDGAGGHADPYFWRPVFDRPNAPPIMIAHFGGFEYQSADPEGQPSGPRDASKPLPFDSSWEASLARYISRNPEKPVFADISMFIELFDSSRHAFLLDRFRELDRRYPAMKQHLVFGTDWTMLATQSRAPQYDVLARAFLESAFGTGALPDIMRNNFLRFSGLSAEQPARRRIEAFYGGDAQLLHRLSLLDRP